MKRTLLVIAFALGILGGHPTGSFAQYDNQAPISGDSLYAGSNPNAGLMMAPLNNRPLGAPGSVLPLPYLNQPGFGYYRPNPYAPVYPNYGQPSQANGYFYFGRGGLNAGYWRSPSGYYYPLYGYGLGAGVQQPPVIVVQQGNSAPSQPPVADMFKDLRTYLDEQNSKGKFSAEDHRHLSLRLKDLTVKEASMRSRNNGSLDSVDEENIRKDLAMLQGDMARRVKP